MPTLLFLPVILALAWGVYFADDTYIPLHYAQNLAAGKGLTGFVGDVPWLRSPLWTAVLILAALLRLPLTYTALVLSALGWGAAAVLLYQTAVTNKTFFVLAVLPGFLLGLNPVVVNTLGGEFPWLLVLALLAMRQTAVFPLLPLIHFGWPTVVVNLALLGWYIWQHKPFPVWPIVGLLLTAAGWAAFSWWHFGRLVAPTLSVSAFVVAGFFFLMSWGLSEVTGRLRDKVQLSAEQTAVGLALLIGIPLFMTQSYLLWQQYRLRATDYQQLQAQIGHWLREEAASDETVWASAQIGYLAQRPVWQWQGQPGDEKKPTELLPHFGQRPPAIFVSERTLTWDQLIRTVWFQERYQPAAIFQSPYEPRSPFTIWTYQETAFDESTPQPTQIKAENGLNLMAFQYSPPVIAPNEAVYVTLYWQTVRPITTTFNTVVRLVSPLDQVAWAQRDLDSPRSVPPAWLESGDWFAERFVLTTTAEIPSGGYELNLSLYNESHPSEFINLYQDEDSSGLDRVVLGYVAVPWLGEMGEAIATQATFGNQIQLIGYELAGTSEPGAAFTVRLYWEALHPPDENYTVFVHLLDENGQLVANHDGPPFYGRFPTRAWPPGYTIPDEHPLTLPDDLSSGRYQLRVGLYLLATGERLPVVDAAGTEIADRAFTVDVIEMK